MIRNLLMIITCGVLVTACSTRVEKETVVPQRQVVIHEEPRQPQHDVIVHEEETDDPYMHEHKKTTVTEKHY